MIKVWNLYLWIVKYENEIKQSDNLSSSFFVTQTDVCNSWCLFVVTIIRKSFRKDHIRMRMILEWSAYILIEAKINNVFKFLEGNEHEISSNPVQFSMNRFVVANLKGLEFIIWNDHLFLHKIHKRITREFLHCKPD